VPDGRALGYPHPRLSEVTSSSARLVLVLLQPAFQSASIVTRRARKPLEVSVRWAPVTGS